VSLSKADEDFENKYKVSARGMDLDKLTDRAAQVLGVSKKKVWAVGKRRQIVEARSLLCYWAVRESGISMAVMARRVSISSPAVSQSVQGGEKIASENGYRLIEK
jgi:hypothetical protein